MWKWSVQVLNLAILIFYVYVVSFGELWEVNSIRFLQLIFSFRCQLNSSNWRPCLPWLCNQFWNTIVPRPWSVDKRFIVFSFFLRSIIWIIIMTTCSVTHEYCMGSFVICISFLTSRFNDWSIIWFYFWLFEVPTTFMTASVWFDLPFWGCIWVDVNFFFLSNITLKTTFLKFNWLLGKPGYFWWPDIHLIWHFVIRFKFIDDIMFWHFLICFAISNHLLFKKHFIDTSSWFNVCRLIQFAW